MTSSPPVEPLAAAAVVSRVAQCPPVPPPTHGPWVQWLSRTVLRGLMAGFHGLHDVASWLRPHPRPIPRAGCDVLLTGTFHSPNWALAHLRPLARSRHVARVRVVSPLVLPPMERVHVIAPPRWLGAMLGGTLARLLTFIRLALFTRPDVVGGFHLLVNGLLAAVCARCAGARSLYLSVGGPLEILGGGLWGNPWFSHIGRPDKALEESLIRAVARCDLVVTMGTEAARYFRARGVDARIEVIAGGIDGDRFQRGDGRRDIDIIFVARFDPIKRLDTFLRAVELARRQLPGLRVCVVGDGPGRTQYEELARMLDLDGCVVFAGMQTDIASWLQRARLLALTSDSEGLSLALMEAMHCGLPAVVSDVGDLADLVEDGINGWRVGTRSPEEFARRFVGILRDRELWPVWSEAAARAAARYEVGRTAELWDQALGAWGSAGGN